MIKKVSIFQLFSGGSRDALGSGQFTDWPESVKERFRGNLSRGTFSFDAESEHENEFLEILRGTNLNIFRSEVHKVTGKDIYEFPFHYLSPRGDTNYEKDVSLDTSSSCPGDTRLNCGLGATQVSKLTIDKDRSKKLDIMSSGAVRPFTYFVSRKLRDLLVDQAFSGYRLVPCLRAGEHYSDQERSLDFVSERLEVEATHFQLIVTGRVVDAPDVGEVVYVFSECSKCGAIHGGLFDFPRFKSETFSADDFQLLWKYESSNRGRFEIMGELLIVSKAVLRFLRENKFSGLGPFLTDPRIPHGVVNFVP